MRAIGNGRPSHSLRRGKPANLKSGAGHVAELADALDLGSSGATHQSSSLCVPREFAAESREFSTLPGPPLGACAPHAWYCCRPSIYGVAASWGWVSA